MGLIIGFILCVICAAVVPTVLTRMSAREVYTDGEHRTETPKAARLGAWALRAVFSTAAVCMIVFTSLITVGDNEIALMKRIYFASDLPQGRIIGVGLEKGKKAETIGPGFHFMLGLNIVNDVEKVPMITVAPGHYRTLSARDGKPLPQGVTYAPDFGSELLTYLDAKTFLSVGEEDTKVGFKGPQTTILPPGTWRVNTYLWDVSQDRPATTIEQGFVGVIKANTQTSVNFGAAMTVAYPTDCNDVAVEGRLADALVSPLKPVGCVGIWDKVLPPSRYYVNEDVFQVTKVDTRVQAWEYKGNYLSRAVDLSVDAAGEITQVAREERVERPESAVDDAIGVKIDGYTINQSARVLVQVTPQNAPFIVASVGGMDEVENRIISPAVQSAIRDLSGQKISLEEVIIDGETGKPQLDEAGNAKTRSVRRPVSPLDFIENRGLLQDLAEKVIKPEGSKAGVEIKEVRFLAPDMPPEVLIPRKRQQLAFEMIETLKKEQAAQIERIEKANAQARAEQQPELVKAQLAVQRANEYEKERAARGRADRNYLEQVAAGQEAQANVLGKELVARLKMMELILENPDALAQLGKTVPSIVVMNGGGEGGSAGIGSLEGLAAVLSGSGVLANQQGVRPGAAKVATSQ